MAKEREWKWQKRKCTQCGYVTELPYGCCPNIINASEPGIVQFCNAESFVLIEEDKKEVING